ncbi:MULTISPECIES: VOC family protein [Streptosporangium]|uniref:Catechol 2,3-dioxygenase-like lactoylglutathione lyase family enzyme n=1 Tax=Streptosporangium brasiliense TaxID=47480 RepID=A0ABT9RD81_9ACTN|nr:VOC family protein [Streptosporangium brasiliense]MDP9867213.1 catechol 2,3-dioxygenase-like lactoylglutathione lyase family enzyme [Streptosporangium brasiliense]
MRQTLVVIYTSRLEECRDFYASLGLEFRPEQHGDGPRHHAATLPDGTVFELYPAGEGGETGRLRLGFVAAGATEGAGRRLLRDPDGRVVELQAGDWAAAVPTAE